MVPPYDLTHKGQNDISDWDWNVLPLWSSVVNDYIVLYRQYNYYFTL
jgi:hypothetical protein